MGCGASRELRSGRVWPALFSPMHTSRRCECGGTNTYRSLTASGTSGSTIHRATSRFIAARVLLPSSYLYSGLLRNSFAFSTLRRAISFRGLLLLPLTLVNGFPQMRYSSKERSGKFNLCHSSIQPEASIGTNDLPNNAFWTMLLRCAPQRGRTAPLAVLLKLVRAARSGGDLRRA